MDAPASGSSAPEKSPPPKEFDGQQADDLLNAKRLAQKKPAQCGIKVCRRV